MLVIPTPAEVMDMVLHANDDKRMQIFTGNVVPLAFAFVAVGLRFLSRRVAKTTIQADDILIVVGLLISTVAVICYCISTRYGMGQHVIKVTSAKDLTSLMMAMEALYPPAFVAIKLSILLLYRRLFPLPEFEPILLGTGVFVIMMGITCFFCIVLQCVPFEALWNPLVHGVCYNAPLAALVTAVLNLLTDYWILILPMPILWKMKIVLPQKISLMGIFLLGGGTCVIATLRAFYVTKISGSPDPTYVGVEGMTTSVLELLIGIISACLPTYRPLFRRVRVAVHRVRIVEDGMSQGSHHSDEKKEEDIARQLSFQNKSFPSQLNGPCD